MREPTITGDSNPRRVLHRKRMADRLNERLIGLIGMSLAHQKLTWCCD